MFFWVAATFVVTLSLQELPPPQDHVLSISEGASVEVRGFLYQTEENQFILATQPNLKSCCLSPSSKTHPHIFVEGLSLQHPSFSRPVTLQGSLQVASLSDSEGKQAYYYLLTEAILKPEQNRPHADILRALFGILILLN